jgi:aconitate hydratase 2/2-methylisocitrate dehydratase
MTNIGHYRAAGKMLKDYGQRVPTTLWIAPPTKMDAHQLMEEGFYSTFGLAGARTEIPGCSLCMGNQARVRDGSTVISTSTRNFPGRLGKDANVYLCSAELAAIAAVLGRLPTIAEYMEKVSGINTMATDIYRYLNFDKMKDYQAIAENVARIKEVA